MSECTTHHHACDCREQKLKETTQEISEELAVNVLLGDECSERILKVISEFWREQYGVGILEDGVKR